MSHERHIDEDHRALDHALADVEFLAQKRSFGSAMRQFEAFCRALEAHLDEEETVILPELEHRTGDPDRVLPIVRGQHQTLEVTLKDLCTALARADYTAFCNGLTELDRLLKEHHATEERLLARNDCAPGVVPADLAPRSP
jgi:hemerythrin